MADYTPYQRKLIERYYDQRDHIMLTRLSEIVTELTLAESERKRDQLWRRAATAMKNLKIPGPLRRHILDSREPTILAHNLREWQRAAGRSGRP